MDNKIVIRVATWIFFVFLLLGVTKLGWADDMVGASLDHSFVSTGRTPYASETGKCVVFRRTFEIQERTHAARIHLFANSRYIIWVNGQYFDRGPGRFEPAAPEYDSFDISPKLVLGKNAISIMVTGPLSNGKIAWRPLGLTVQGTVEKDDLATNSKWKWSDQTRYRSVTANWADVLDLADARTEDGDWTKPEYDDHAWQAAVPQPSKLSTITVSTQVDGKDTTLTVDPIVHPNGFKSWWGPLATRRIPQLAENPVVPAWTEPLPKELNAGESVGFRFPHLVLAYIQFEIEADEGTVIELPYAPEFRYVCRAGVQSFMASDTHSVMEGSVLVRSGRATIRKVDFVERLYPFKRVGRFHSNDPLLNRLWTTCVRGLEVTSEDAYVDCADRERVEWMDCDPPVFDVTRVAVTGPGEKGLPIPSDPRLLEELLRRTAYSIQPDGWVKAHTSSDRFDIHAKMEDRACDWIEGARRYYESCGNKEVIREIWPMIVKQLNYFLSRRSSRGLVNAREWVVWGNPVGYQTCEGTALNAFVAKACGDAAYLGDLIDRDADATRFGKAGREIADAINLHLWNEQAGTYYGGYYDLQRAKAAPDFRPLTIPVVNHLIDPTRHAALFCLDQGVVPPERVERATKYLMTNRPQDNSIMQYYYFFKQQYRVDQSNQDLDVLQTLRREWKDMAESPYEATFEGLHSWGSQAHCYGMYPAYFLSSYVLGVRLDGPAQNKRLLIEPRLGDLTEASGTVVTEFGPVDVEWKRAGPGWTYLVRVPDHITARLRLPVERADFVKLNGQNVYRPEKVGRWLEIELSAGTYSGSW